jgi:protein farnesyltransferase/geranylgeranyltransferase type-1 subunit alpha
MAETTKSDDAPAAEAQETSLVDDVELWKDVTPIPQGDAERPMVQIAYEPEYRKAMNLFRGILKKDERSERALKLTTLILQYNPGHYTVWYVASLMSLSLSRF